MTAKAAGNPKVVMHEVMHALLEHKLPKYLATSGVKGKKYKQALDKALKDKSIPTPLKDIIRGYLLAAEKLGAEEMLWGDGPVGKTYSKTLYYSANYLGAPTGAKTKVRPRGGRTFSCGCSLSRQPVLTNQWNVLKASMWPKPSRMAMKIK